MTTSVLQSLDHDLAERAQGILNALLGSYGVSKADARRGLAQGFGLARWRGSEPNWTGDEAGNPIPPAAAVAGRLVVRLAHELNLPLESLSGPSAHSIAQELLAA